MTRAERYARTAEVVVPDERRHHVRCSLRAGVKGARAWYLWQRFPDITPADLRADTGWQSAHSAAASFAARVGLPIRRSR